MSLLWKTAEWLKRKPEDTAQLYGRTNLISKNLLFASVCGFFVMTTAPILYGMVASWKDARPQVAIPKQEWHTLKDAPANSGASIAAPSNPLLWETSPTRNADRKSNRSQNVGEVFWVGSKIPTSLLSEASITQANYLVLGLINGSYQLWIDGQRIQSGEWANSEPIIVPIPVSRLKDERPLYVAIEINNDIGHSNPDTLNYMFGEHLGEGFYDRSHAHSYRTMISFAQTVRPFALFLANLMIALVFFTVWSMGRTREEYFYLSMYAAVGAFFQLLHTDFVYLGMLPKTFGYLNTLLVFYEGVFAALLGFAFARSRRSIFRWAIPIAGIAPWIVMLWEGNGSLTQTSVYNSGLLFNNKLNPFLYATGALACLIRGVQLRDQSAIRSRRLFLFSAGLFGLAVLLQVQGIFWNQLGFLVNMLMYRFGHFALVLYLAVLALHDYNKERKLLENSPVSPYHRRPNLPERIKGAVLIVDIKQSERLFRSGAERGEGGAFVQACLTAMIESVAKHKGVVLQTEGDAIRAFFDEETCPDPTTQALTSVDQIVLHLEQLSNQFKELGLMPESRQNLEIRGGLAYGEIKPAWQQVAGDRYATWVESGNTNPIVDAARLLELEKAAAKQLGLDEASLVLVREDLIPSETVVPLHSKWIARGMALQGKHGQTYKFSVHATQAQVLQAKKLREDKKFKGAI